MKEISRLITFFAIFFICFWAPGALASAPSPQIMIILDASGSMYGKINGQTKIDVAKQVIHKIVPAISPKVKVGLSAYGHHRKGDCSDMEIILKPGEADRKVLLERMDAISPKGMTPIARSITAVADTLKGNEAETTIILVSDGKETCSPDPCGVVRRLKASGIKFVLDVIGFDVSAEEKEQLMCMANVGGGRYYGADDASSLLAALKDVKKEVEKKIEPAKSVKKSAVIGLGKLDVEFNKHTGGSIFELKVINQKTNKVVARKEFHNTYVPSFKTPLLSGDYEIRSFCCGLYREKMGEVVVGRVHIEKGKTTVYRPGVIYLNFSKEMEFPVITAVTYEKTDEPKMTMTQQLTGGYPYCVRAPRALIPGRYNVTINQEINAITVAKDLEVKEGQVSSVDIDTGFVVKKASDNVVGYRLVRSGETSPVLDVHRDFFRDILFYGKYIVEPGSYDLYLYVKGLGEPLAVANGLEITKGQVLEFDATI